MYSKFKKIDGSIDDAEIYSNGDIVMYVNFLTDTIRIAKCIEFDRWSNSHVKICDIPYTNDEYDKFDSMITELCESNVVDKNYKKLRFN